MNIGDFLKEDQEFEQARYEGIIVEVRQQSLRIYRPGKITGFSQDHISVDNKKFLRSANQFLIVDKT